MIKGCNIFLGQILANTCSFVGGRIILQQEKISRAEILFQNPKNYILGMFKDSAIILDAIRRSFLTNSATTAAMFTSFRVDFGRPPLSSSSTSSRPSRNREYHLKTFDRFTASFP
jgi:hypothetical protein